MASPDTDSHERFTRLLVANQRRIDGFIFTLVQDPVATDDILQETVSMLWQKFDSFEPGTDFGAWAMRVARFKVLEWRRRQQRLPLPIDDELLLELASKAEAAQSYDQVSRKEALASCTSRLKLSDVALLRARYSEEESVAQIAARMGRTRDAVYKVLARIHRDLRLCVKGKLDQVGGLA
jgi:RNA polymerase sigma-70 factor (ECF subfamily)